MFTIKEASSRTGIPAASLRAWERRYAVVTPQRSDGGYRLYDERAIAALTTMKRLIEEGWSPAAAAAAVSTDQAPRTVAAASPGSESETASDPGRSQGARLTESFLAAAAAVEPLGVEAAVQQAFTLGSFEHVTDNWLMPTLRELGDAWADGRVDVAGEHAASNVVMRHLAQAFSAAVSVSRGPRVVVGLPAGAHHELGALAFAVAARRRGLAVVYVGADLPRNSWLRAVRAFPTSAAVIAVPTPSDRSAAAETATSLLERHPDMVVAAGGAESEALAAGVGTLPASITDAARALDELPG